MAENNNNSNDNGGADDEILAAIQSHITKAKSREACYVFGDVIKDPMKAIYGDKWRAVVFPREPAFYGGSGAIRTASRAARRDWRHVH